MEIKFSELQNKINPSKIRSLLRKSTTMITTFGLLKLLEIDPKDIETIFFDFNYYEPSGPDIVVEDVKITLANPTKTEIRTSDPSGKIDFIDSDLRIYNEELEYVILNEKLDIKTNDVDDSFLDTIAIVGEIDENKAKNYSFNYFDFETKGENIVMERTVIEHGSIISLPQYVKSKPLKL